MQINGLSERIRKVLAWKIRRGKVLDISHEEKDTCKPKRKPRKHNKKKRGY